MTPGPADERTDADVEAFWGSRRELPVVAIVVTLAAAVTVALLLLYRPCLLFLIVAAIAALPALMRDTSKTIDPSYIIED